MQRRRRHAAHRRRFLLHQHYARCTIIYADAPLPAGAAALLPPRKSVSMPDSGAITFLYFLL